MRFASGVVSASRSGGASETGLTRLIWNQVLSFGSDAMVTVALAGTVFFAAARSDQKINVAGYLLVTMLPFALIAPVIGPVLDRVQYGRRWALAGTAIGRSVCAIFMARHFEDLLILFPLALGSLVLSKAYSVLRASAVPRLLPPGLSLVAVNGRLSAFGLAATVVGGGSVALVIRFSHSYSAGLYIAAAGFAATAYFAFSLPRTIDAPARSESDANLPGGSTGAVPIQRGFGRDVRLALAREAMLRFGAGFLTIFLAFHIQRTRTGSDGVLALFAIAAASGIGQAVGVTVGTRARLAHPTRLLGYCLWVCTVATALTAGVYSITAASLCMATTSATNSLGKLSLDSLIQSSVTEDRRSRAFARSETALQLAWVVGAAVSLLLPARRAHIGLAVSAAVLLTGAVLLHRRQRRSH